jgi:hypothetical protein
VSGLGYSDESKCQCPPNNFKRAVPITALGALGRPAVLPPSTEDGPAAGGRTLPVRVGRMPPAVMS